MTRASWARRLPLLGCLAALLVVLGLGPLCALAASWSPVPPAAPSHLDRSADPAAPRLHVRDLPAGLTAAQLADPWADLAPLAERVLGKTAATATIARIRRGDPAPYLNVASASGTAYPSHFAWIDELLDSAPDGARIPEAAALAARLIVIAAPRSNVDPSLSSHPDAAPLAYALLTRAAQAADSCDVELDRLLLLAADDKPRDDVVEGQAEVTSRACPGEVTPLWLLGQYQLQRARLATLGEVSESERDTMQADRFTRSAATADHLVEQFPGSPDAWLGFADASLQAGVEVAGRQPFTSRRDLERARDGYAEAARLEPSVAARVGQARALSRLGEPGEALALTGDSAATPSPGPVLEVVLAGQEAARDWRGAGTTAGELDRLGAAAYPHTGPLHPRNAPLSSGVGTVVPLLVALAPGPTNGSGGGADVADLGFLPDARPVAGVTDAGAVCPQEAQLRADILTGDPRTAAGVNATSVTTPSGRFCELRDLRAVGSLEAGLPLPKDGPQADRAADERQNLWRWAGDLDRAAASITAWDAGGGGSGLLPALRLGEVRFLQGRCTDAAALFAEADRRGEQGYDITPDQGRARLDRGAALVACGRGAEAMPLLRRLDEQASTAAAAFARGTGRTVDADVAHRYAVLSYYARLQLADAERVGGAFDAAVEDYAAAAERLPGFADQQQSRFVDDDVLVVPGVVENNRALAELERNQPVPAVALAQAACAADPESPVFLLTLATAQRQAGQVEAGAATDARVLALEPTAFPAWNDRAVALAAAGHPDQARAALRRAVATRPVYALGWFNLAVLESRRGPLAALVAEGAYARAFAVDPSLTDAPRTLAYDEHSYRTGLDVSKPVPWSWSFAGVERRAPVAPLGVLGVLVAVLVALRGFGEPVGGYVNQAGVLVNRATGRVRLLHRRRHVLWAAAATVVTFGLTAVHGQQGGVAPVVVLLAGVACLIAAATGARTVAARRVGVRLVQRSWPPGMLVGLVSGAFGTPFAPMPYVRGPTRTAWIHLVAPVLLVVVGALLLAESHVVPAPVVRALAVAALTMAVSLLVPLRPLDGAGLSRGGAAAGVAAVLVAGLVALGLV